MSFDPFSVVQAAADVCGVEPGDVLGTSRRPRYVVPRHLCMYVLHRDVGWSLPEIGDMFERDHTSVLHAVRRYEERMKLDARLAHLLDRVRIKSGTHRELPSNVVPFRRKHHEKRDEHQPSSPDGAA